MTNGIWIIALSLYVDGLTSKLIIPKKIAGEITLLCVHYKLGTFHCLLPYKLSQMYKIRSLLAP